MFVTDCGKRLTGKSSVQDPSALLWRAAATTGPVSLAPGHLLILQVGAQFDVRSSSFLSCINKSVFGNGGVDSLSVTLRDFPGLKGE